MVEIKQLRDEISMKQVVCFSRLLIVANLNSSTKLHKILYGKSINFSLLVCLCFQFFCPIIDVRSLFMHRSSSNEK